MKKLLISACLAMMFCCTAYSATDDELAAVKKENAELKQRVTKLETELEQIKKIVFSGQAKPQPVEPSSLSDDDLQKIAKYVQDKGATSNKKSVWSSLDIQVYGFIKADASYDNSRTTPGNFVLYADNEQHKRNDNEFNITANQTRLGMKIKGPDNGKLKTSGRVEIDFYGNYASENKAKIQLRHAYMTLDWPDDNFNIIAGQTSDVISPLNPMTLNYTVLWDAGNIGYRRPQIRLTKVFPDGDRQFKLEGAIARTISSSFAASEAGADSGHPTFQARASVRFPWINDKTTEIGVSGHWGKEEYDVNAVNYKNKKFDSWSFNIDLTQPINDWLKFKGEFFCGENLGTYFGGIGQGVNTTTMKEIRAKGGWVAVTIGPFDKWTFNVGGGMDCVKEDDISTGGRQSNRSIFGNLLYAFNKHMTFGFELSHWRTEYKGHGDAENLRAQTSFIYKF